MAKNKKQKLSEMQWLHLEALDRGLSWGARAKDPNGCVQAIRVLTRRGLAASATLGMGSCITVLGRKVLDQGRGIHGGCWKEERRWSRHDLTVAYSSITEAKKPFPRPNVTCQRCGQQWPFADLNPGDDFPLHLEDYS